MNVRTLITIFVFLFVVAECSFAGLINLKVEGISLPGAVKNASREASSTISKSRICVVEFSGPASCLQPRASQVLAAHMGSGLIFGKQRVETGAGMDSLLRGGLPQPGAETSWLGNRSLGGMTGVELNIRDLSNGAKPAGRWSMLCSPLDISDLLSVVSSD